MFRIFLSLSLCLSLVLSTYNAKADIFGDLIEGAVDSAINKALEEECKEPEAGVCKCSPYNDNDGTGNTDIAYNWDNCTGKFTYTSGDTIEGPWKNGELNGKGTLTYSDRTKFIANFKNGKMVGPCTRIDNKGKKENGNCAEGKFTVVKNSGDKFAEILSNYYGFNEYYRRCNSSGMLTDKKYGGFKKNMQELISLFQKEYGIEDKDVKGLKKIASDMGRKQHAETIALMTMAVGFGKPRDEYTAQEYVKVKEMCDTNWSIGMTSVRTTMTAMKNGNKSNKDIEPDF